METTIFYRDYVGIIWIMEKKWKLLYFIGIIMDI